MKHLLSFVLVFLLASPCVMAQDEFLARLDTVTVRPGSYETPLVRQGLAVGAIIAPAAPEYQAVARQLSAAIAAQTGAELPVLKDGEASAGRGRGLQEKYRRIPTILLGNINNNEAIVPLYARFLCFSDGAYPGNGGYELRTIRNPWGTQANVLLLGATDLEGLKTGTAAFLALQQLQLKRNDGRCGFLFQVQPRFSAEAKAGIDEAVSEARKFVAQAAADATQVIDEGHTYTLPMAYLLTGDTVLAQALSLNALHIAAKNSSPFPLHDYNLETYTRLLQVSTNNNLVEDETVRQLDRQALTTLYALRNEYWLVTHAGDIGSRHQMSGTLAYLTLTDLLQKNLAEDAAPVVRDFLNKQFQGAYSHYKYIVDNSYAGNEDNNSTATNMVSVLQFALSYGETAGFENGQVDIGIRKMIASVDNSGYGPGAGTYEDAYPEGATKTVYRNGAPLAVAAFYHRDGKLKWLFENRPGLEWGSWFGRNPFGLHQYATDDAVPAQEPAAGELNTFWVHHKAVDSKNYKSSPGFPRERLFDKAVIRTGFAPNQSYLIFQGLQLSEDSEAGAEDALCLLRYTDRGQLWLATNSQLRNSWWRNSFVVSDGFGGSGGDGAPRLDICAAGGDASAFSGTLREVRGGQWNRWAVHLRGRFTVVTDIFIAGKAGDYAFATSWKTPVPAQLNGKGLVADKAGLRFSIQGAGVDNASMDQGIAEMDAQKFWYLRQTGQSRLKAGEKSSIANVLSVQGRDSALWPAITRLNADTYLVHDAKGEVLVGRGPCNTPVFETDAALFVIEAGRATLFGATFYRQGNAPRTRIRDNDAQVLTGDFAPLLRETAKKQQPQKPSAALASNNFKNVRDVPSLGEALKPITGYTVSPKPLRDADRLDDNVTALYDAGTQLDAAQPLVVDFGREVRLKRMNIEVGATVYAPLAPQPKSKLTRLNLTGSRAGFKTDNVTLNPAIKFAPEVRELYKIGAWQVERYEADVDATPVRYLKIEGLPAKLTELTFFSDTPAQTTAENLRAVDLDGDGRQEFLVETSKRRIDALSADGDRLFSISLPNGMTSWIAEDLDGEGKASIVVASQDLRLHKFDWQGREVKISEPLTYEHPYTVNALAIGGQKRKQLAVTNYYSAELFDANLASTGRIPHVGGMWLNNAAPMDLDGDGNDDLVMLDIYKHLYAMDSQRQRSAGLWWTARGLTTGIWPWGQVTEGVRPVLMAATAEVALRHLSTTAAESKLGQIMEGDVRDWTVTDGSVLAASLPVDLDGDGVPELVLAKAIGHVVVLGNDGKVLRTLALPGTLRCLQLLQTVGGPRVLVGTSVGLYAYDRDWKQVGFRPGAVTHLAVSGTTIAAAQDDGRINLLQLAGGG